MTQSLAGGCLCGGVRYECAAEAVVSAICHCLDCQKVFGGALGGSLAVPADALAVTGELTFYETTADSGNTVSRGFCPTCGTPVMASSTGMPTLNVLTACSLDDPNRFQPQFRLFTKRAPDWVHLPDHLPSFTDMPEEIPQAS